MPLPPSIKRNQRFEATPAYSSKKARVAPSVAPLPSELGKCIKQDVELLRRVGWKQFVRMKRGVGDLGTLNFDHPAQQLLRHYKHHGAPVRFSTQRWSRQRVRRALSRGAHKSCFEFLDFLQDEFVDMIKKDQWVILPFSEVEGLDGCASRPRVACHRETGDHDGSAITHFMT